MKIYFMPVWGDSAETIYNTMRMQTPDSKGTWKDMTATIDMAEADYFVVQDYTDISPPDKDKTYYFAREVPGAGRVDDIDAIKKFSWIDGTSYLYTKWVYPQNDIGGVKMSYDSLVSQAPVKKSANLICIQSGKYFLEGHKKRVDFINRVIWGNTEHIDLCGSIRKVLSYGGPGEEKVFDKFEKLKDYRYCLAFDNGQHKNYFGTQFTDALLSWTVPIYWGAPNISEFFPEDSYINLDINDSRAFENILDNLGPEDYERRLPAMKKARDLILNKYNIWPTIHEALTTGKVTWGLG